MPTNHLSRPICFCLLATMIIFLISCAQPKDSNQTDGTKLRSVQDPEESGKQSAESPTTKVSGTVSIKRVPDSEIENLHQLSSKIYTGGEPHSEQHFAAIAKLGCKTVISVDGAKPNIALAEKYGLKYVHIPIGYDQIDRPAQLSIAHAVKSAPAPFYFHCHHGKHRGPSAAAIGLITETGCSSQEGLKVLEATGTSKDYGGLWRDVSHYKLPDAEEKLPELVSVAQVDSLVASMSILDRSFDNLKLLRDTEWKTPPTHPDLVALNEAKLVRESFTEAKRLLSKEWPEDFMDWMNESRMAAEQLEQGFKKEDKEQILQSFRSLENGCKQCHKKYRN